MDASIQNEQSKINREFNFRDWVSQHENNINIRNNTEPELLRDITNDNAIKSQHSSSYNHTSAFKLPKSKIPNKDVITRRIPVFK
jgi:hypothetical protein